MSVCLSVGVSLFVLNIFSTKKTNKEVPSVGWAVLFFHVEKSLVVVVVQCGSISVCVFLMCVLMWVVYFICPFHDDEKKEQRKKKCERKKTVICAHLRKIEQKKKRNKRWKGEKTGKKKQKAYFDEKGQCKKKKKRKKDMIFFDICSDDGDFMFFLYVCIFDGIFRLLYS